MLMPKRTLLIVEDDPLLSMMYKLQIEEALSELPHVEVVVKQAFDYDQAKQFIDTHSVDFISVDIALSKHEEGKNDEQREDKEAGGITLLQYLQQGEKKPLALIVSGEPLQSYVVDAYGRYRVLAFYQKARFSNEAYKNAIKAAFFYLDTVEIISHLESEIDIEIAEKNWQKARETAKDASIAFPEDLGKTIKLICSERINRITGLPTGNWTREEIKSKVAWHDQWTIIRLTINGYSKFVATYTSQEEPILNFVAELLKRARDKYKNQKLFVGHLQNQEYASDPGFVIISSEMNFHQSAKDMAGWIKKEFTKTGSIPFSRQLEGQKYPKELTFTVEATVLTGSEACDPEELLDILGSTPFEGQ